MKVVLTAAIALCFAATAAAEPKFDAAIGAAIAGAKANRIVGLWSANVEVGLCAGGPRRVLRSQNNFHAGGTLTDVGSVPPTERSVGLGVWAFDPREETYSVRMQFYRFLPTGEFDGVNDIRRESVLAADGNSATEAVNVRVLNLDGSLRVELCGTANATRVLLD